MLLQQIIQNIEKFQKSELSLKHLTARLYRHREFLLSMSTKEGQTHTEIAYIYFYKPNTICDVCSKEMLFGGFSKGYKCSKKCETSKELNKITKEEAIIKIKELYIKYDCEKNRATYKSFSFSCKKYINRFFHEERKSGHLKCLYDILYGENKEMCKICGTKRRAFSTTSFKYSHCCSVSCMTKYQMKELTPWTEDSKEKMVEKVKQTKLTKYNDCSYNNTKKSLETRIRNGNCLSIEDKPFKDLYNAEVNKYTRKNSKNLIGREKQGRAGVAGAYHLDHKFSVMEGFINNILPSIIGSQHNLEYIPWEENQKKNKKCSITLIELFDLYK